MLVYNQREQKEKCIQNKERDRRDDAFVFLYLTRRTVLQRQVTGEEEEGSTIDLRLIRGAFIRLCRIG